MNNKRFGEIIRFVVTGGACFVVELVFLILFRDGLHMPTWLATAIAFTISVIVNYLMCMVWVFNGAKDGGNKAKAGFFITSIMGLGWNELLMWLFGMWFGEDVVLLSLFGFNVSMYMVNKMLATLIVMVWNYFTKRLVLKAGKADA